jgi:transposase-like protein
MMKYKFVCPGCESRHVTEVPKHDAPYRWSCNDEACGWSMTIQTDPHGISIGWNKPLQKPHLSLVK